MSGRDRTSDLRWVRSGQQSRSQKTQEKLLEAAAELLGDKGVEATSVADVATRANCSVGSVYHHFRDKQTLLYAVFDRMCEELRATTEAAIAPERWEGASVADIMRDYVTFALETGRDRPKFKRAGYAVAQNDVALQERLLEIYRVLHDGINGLLRSRSNEIGHPDPELAIEFVQQQLSSMVRTRLEDEASFMKMSARSDAEFVHELLVSVCTYLQIDPLPDFDNP